MSEEPYLKRGRTDPNDPYVPPLPQSNVSQDVFQRSADYNLGLPYTSDNTVAERDGLLTEHEPLDRFGISSQLSDEAINEIESQSIEAVPEFPEFFFDELPDKSTVENLITFFSNIIKNIREKADEMTRTVIKDTKDRENKKNEKYGLSMSNKAIEVLQNISNKSKEVEIDQILRVVNLEELLLMVSNWILFESVKDMKPFLVMPIISGILYFNEEYFGFDDNITPLIVERAYSEFSHAQKIIDKVLQLYGNDITIIEIIKELVSIVDNLHSVTPKITKDKALTINGYIQIIKDIYTLRETDELGTIPNMSDEQTKIPVLTAVKYSDILNNNVGNKDDVDAEIAKLRNPVDASAQGEAVPAIPVGRNTRHMGPLTDAGPVSFNYPMTSTVSASSDTYIDPGRQDIGISEFPDAIEDEEHSGTYKNPNTRALVLTSEQVFHGIPLSENVKKYIHNIAEKQKAQSIPNLKTAEMANIAARRAELANSLFNLVQNLQTNIKIDQNMLNEQKEKLWDREIHRIFLQWYNEHIMLEEARAALDANAKASSGGKKSRKHKKHLNKKSTRKHKKRYTRKLHKKHKRGHTKKH